MISADTIPPVSGTTLTFDNRKDFQIWAVVAWIGMQLLAVVLIDLSGQRLATPSLEAVGAVQIGWLALTFPDSLRGWRAMWISFVAAVPFLALAGRHDGAPANAMAWLGMVLFAWHLALGMWATLLPSQPRQMAAIALAAATILGAPASAYLAAEFASGGPPTWLFNLASPITWLLRPDGPHFPPPAEIWPFPAIVLGIGIILRWRAVRNVPQVTSYPHQSGG